MTMWVLSGRAELAVARWGTEGPAIVALHPGVGDSRIWQWCAPAWAEAGFRVIAYDRRGFGKTRYVAEPHDEVEDLLAVTAANDGRPAVIIGNSKGGGLALDLASAHADDVRALVLIAPSPSGYPDEWPVSAAESELDTRIEQAEATGDLEQVNRLEVHYWLDGPAQPEGRVVGEPRELMLDMNLRALRAEPVGDSAERQPAWSALGQITVPVLVIVGSYDELGTPGMCSALRDALPDARLVTMAGSAHCPSLDRPDELNRIVIEFIDSLEQSTTGPVGL